MLLLLSRSVMSNPFAISQIVAHQAPLSMEFCMQEYWSGFPFPSPLKHAVSVIIPLSTMVWLCVSHKFLLAIYFTYGNVSFHVTLFIYLTLSSPLPVSVSLSSMSVSPLSSVTQSCPTLCDPMNHSMPGLPVHHQLLEFTQTHVHQVCDAIQPSHPLSSPSPPAPNLFQHQSLFQ